MTTLEIDTPRVCNKCKELPAACSNGRCKPCTSIESKEYRERHLDKIQEYDRKRHARDRDKRLALMKAYHEKNREKRLATEKARYEAESERIKLRCAKYRAENKHKIYEWNGTRRAMLRNACPKWADREVIKILYSYAKILTIQTGIKYHVDHMIPLTGANVCGLHIPANLQVIEATNNMRKGNRIENA